MGRRITAVSVQVIGSRLIGMIGTWQPRPRYARFFLSSKLEITTAGHARRIRPRGVEIARDHKPAMRVEGIHRLTRKARTTLQ